MNIINIAMEQLKIFFWEIPLGNPNQIRRTIMGIQKKFWILVAIYLMTLWNLWLLIIMVSSKLL